MTTIHEVIQYLHSIAPIDLQEKYDNSGLLVGRSDRQCTGVITCLDSTEAVIEEAIQKKCNLIVAHHPIIFDGLKSITGKSYIERVAIKAIKNNISIFAIHTNLDNVLNNGVNEKIGKIMELHDIKILKIKNPIDSQIGSGVIGKIKTPINTLQFLHNLKVTMALQVLKYTNLCKPIIQKVALCGGSGYFLLEEAKKQKADIFITSDIKYHQYFDADSQIVIADIGHYESEKYTADLLHELISKKFSTFACHCTNVITNPVKYLL